MKSAYQVLVLVSAAMLFAGCAEEPADRNGTGGGVDFGARDAGEDHADSGDASVPDVPSPDLGVDVPDVAPDVPVEDPYASVEGLTGAALKDGLHALVAGHRSFDYDDARDLMYGRRGTIDVVEGEIECVYTGRRVVPDRTRTPGGFNTEHSWPRSDGADELPAIADIHHLFPVDPEANSARGNVRFGDVSCGGGCQFSRGGSKLGPPENGGGSAFEVRMERRGDIARAHFYFSIRYQLPIASAEEDALRAWHNEDLPDDIERLRNERIERFQRNRNPFVDRPDFVAAIDNF